MKDTIKNFFGKKSKSKTEVKITTENDSTYINITTTTSAKVNKASLSDLMLLINYLKNNTDNLSVDFLGCNSEVAKSLSTIDKPNATSHYFSNPDKSSWIQELSFNGLGNNGIITMKTKKDTYVYDNETVKTYLSWTRAESLGQHWHEHYRNRRDPNGFCQS